MARILRWATIGSAAAVAYASWAYRRDIKCHYERVRARGTVIPSPYGDVEYTTGGSGPAVLVSHGAGGGYDQGELIAQAVLSDEIRWIAPSRFGYLRSTCHAGATWDDQAHAYAYLLDHLGVDRAAVVALSQGGPSALLFAVLHPERVSSLTLISCGVAPSSAQDQARANQKGAMLKAIFRVDLVYWAITRLFRRQLMGLMGASEAVIAGLTPYERGLVDRVVDYMNPVSLRSAGAAFDNGTPLPGGRIAAIEAPTLIVHATDDTLQLYHNAEFAAATIPGARLERFERGGHLVMAVEQAAIRAAVQQHVN